MSRLITAAIMAAALMGGGCADDSHPVDNAERIAVYCAFGATSDAQYDGCRTHVRMRQIKRLDTPAAQCAKYGGKACDRGGPFLDDLYEQWAMDDLAEAERLGDPYDR